MARVTIVGLDDPYGETPLLPTIPASSGARLFAMTGLTLSEYEAGFDLMNLFNTRERQTYAKGKMRAKSIVRGIIDADDRPHYIVCLGRVVSVSFGLPTDSIPLVFSKVQNNVEAAYLPHTSGRNRWYNERDNVRAANKFMRQLAAVTVGEQEIIVPSGDGSL